MLSLFATFQGLAPYPSLGVDVMSAVFACYISVQSHHLFQPTQHREQWVESDGQ
jgi:hypothetical protein